MSAPCVVEGGGFEPPKLSRQIYSLIPLAARESHLHREIFNNGCCYLKRLSGLFKSNGKIKMEPDDRNRTYDRLITNQLLYQLSYTGAHQRSKNTPVFSEGEILEKVVTGSN